MSIGLELVFFAPEARGKGRVLFLIQVPELCVWLLRSGKKSGKGRGALPYPAFRHCEERTYAGLG